MKLILRCVCLKNLLQSYCSCFIISCHSLSFPFLAAIGAQLAALSQQRYSVNFTASLTSSGISKIIIFRRTRNKLVVSAGDMNVECTIFSYFIFLFVALDLPHLQKNAVCLMPWLVSVSTWAYVSLINDSLYTNLMLTFNPVFFNLFCATPRVVHRKILVAHH